MAADHPACAEWPSGTVALCCGWETSARLGLPSEQAVAQKDGFCEGLCLLEQQRWSRRLH